MSFSSKMKVLFLAFVAAFAVGCGDSGNDFVITGNNNNPNPATTGNLTFLFTTAQSIQVPDGTTSLDFDFFNSANQNVFSTDRAFATSITIENVPIEATEVDITARGAGGVPLAIITDAVAVAGGTTVTVDLSNAIITLVTLDSLTVIPNPVSLDVDGPTTATLAVTGNFSNGESVALDGDTTAVVTLSGTDPSVATTAGSTVTAVGSGATTVDVSVALNGATVDLLDVPVTVGGPAGQLIVQPESLTFNNQGLIGLIGGLLGGGNPAALADVVNSVAVFRAYYIAPGETVPVEVTSRCGVSFGNFVPATVTPNSFTYLNLAGDGIAIATNPLGPTVAYGTTGVMTVTYIDNGDVYTDNVNLLVEDPSLVGIRVASAPNGTQIVPAASSTVQVVAYGAFSNGIQIPLTDYSGTPNPFTFGNSFEIEAATNTSGVSVDANGVITANGADGDVVPVTITANEDGPTATFNVELTTATVDDVRLTPADADGTSDTTAELVVDPYGTYTVSLVFSDGATQDVTTLWPVDYTSTDGGEITGGLFGIINGLIGGSEFGGRVAGGIRGTGVLSLGADTTAINTELTNLGYGNQTAADTANDLADVLIESTVPLGGALSNFP